MKAYLIKVSGDVQGVNYRYFARKEAKKLGLLGWCQNKQDGTVHIFIQGEPVAVEEFIEWSREGSPMATVKSIGVERAELAADLQDFIIR